MSGYTTIRQAAQNVRTAYKKRGWTSRQIGVRSDSYSMGSALRITIKDGQIPMHEAKEIAQSEEHIRRDGYGEILSGGNRYVEVNLNRDARSYKTLLYLDRVKRAIYLLNDPPDNVLQPVIKGYHVGRAANGYGFALWGETSHIQQANSAEGIALALALAVERGQR